MASTRSVSGSSLVYESGKAMRKKSTAIAVFLIVVVAQCGWSQPRPPRSSLCKLEMNAKKGEHYSVQVEGVLLAGLEGAYLVVAHCSGQATMLDFEQVQNHKVLDRMWRIVEKPNQAKGVQGDGAPVLVVFEGDFYGPPNWDPNLPESIRRITSPGWDSNAKTKLVVRRVLGVKELPAKDPCKPPESNPTAWPCFQKD